MQAGTIVSAVLVVALILYYAIRKLETRSFTDRRTQPSTLNPPCFQALGRRIQLERAAGGAGGRFEYVPVSADRIIVVPPAGGAGGVFRRSKRTRQRSSK